MIVYWEAADNEVRVWQVRWSASWVTVSVVSVAKQRSRNLVSHESLRANVTPVYDSLDSAPKWMEIIRHNQLQSLHIREQALDSKRGANPTAEAA